MRRRGFVYKEPLLNDLRQVYWWATSETKIATFRSWPDIDEDYSDLYRWPVYL